MKIVLHQVIYIIKMALKKAGGLVKLFNSNKIIYSDLAELFGAGASSAVFFGNKID